MITRIKETINKKINKKYLILNEKTLKLFILLFPGRLTPNGVPHELHTNLPDNARSARIL